MMKYYSDIRFKSGLMNTDDTMIAVQTRPLPQDIMLA